MIEEHVGLSYKKISGFSLFPMLKNTNPMSSIFRTKQTSAKKCFILELLNV